MPPDLRFEKTMVSNYVTSPFQRPYSFSSDLRASVRRASHSSFGTVTAL